MKKHGIFFVPNIVLGVILGLIIILDIIVVTISHYGFQEIKQKYQGSVYNDDSQVAEVGENPYQWYDLLSVGDISTEAIGTAYKDLTAQEGYQYYRVDIEMKNQGTQSSPQRYMSHFFEGPEYEDVEEVEEDTSAEDISEIVSYNTPIIPAGQTGIVSRVIEVKDGVTSIKMIFYNSDSEKEEYTIELK